VRGITKQEPEKGPAKRTRLRGRKWKGNIFRIEQKKRSVLGVFNKEKKKGKGTGVKGKQNRQGKAELLTGKSSWN